MKSIAQSVKEKYDGEKIGLDEDTPVEIIQEHSPWGGPRATAQLHEHDKKLQDR
jgi:hypothetical protein